MSKRGYHLALMKNKERAKSDDSNISELHKLGYDELELLDKDIIKGANRYAETEKIEDWQNKVYADLDTNGIYLRVPFKRSDGHVHFHRIGQEKSKDFVEIVKRRQKDDLVSKIAVVASLVAGGIGLIVVSSNLTGMAISNLSNSTASTLGTVLVIAGIVGAWIYIKEK